MSELHEAKELLSKLYFSHGKYSPEYREQQKIVNKLKAQKQKEDLQSEDDRHSKKD